MVNDTTPPETEVPWLTDGERGAWMTLISMLMTLPAAIDAQLKRDSGLNFFEYGILSALSRPAGRAVRMNALALQAGGSASRLSHAVSRLERQGWVRRVVNTGEPRCTEAVLTKEGLAVLEAAAPEHVREARRLVFDAIKPDQVPQLQEISRRILQSCAPEIGEVLDRAIADAAEVAALDRVMLDAAADSPCNEARCEEPA